jgi:hypothetical protein
LEIKIKTKPKTTKSGANTIPKIGSINGITKLKNSVRIPIK